MIITDAHGIGTELGLWSTLTPAFFDPPSELSMTNIFPLFPPPWRANWGRYVMCATFELLPSPLMGEGTGG
jgi:hypothetical protein